MESEKKQLEAKINDCLRLCGKYSTPRFTSFLTEEEQALVENVGMYDYNTAYFGGYDDAKRLIYIPAYKYVLENVPSVKRSLDKIRKLLETQDVVLLDYNLNPDNADKSKPLSHAELIKMYLEGRYPEE